PDRHTSRIVDAAFATRLRGRPGKCCGAATDGHEQQWAGSNLERARRIERPTLTLARLCSTPELRPRSKFGGRLWPMAGPDSSRTAPSMAGFVLGRARYRRACTRPRNHGLLGVQRLSRGRVSVAKSRSLLPSSNRVCRSSRVTDLFAAEPWLALLGEGSQGFLVVGAAAENGELFCGQRRRFRRRQVRCERRSALDRLDRQWGAAGDALGELDRFGQESVGRVDGGDEAETLCGCRIVRQTR